MKNHPRTDIHAHESDISRLLNLRINEKINEDEDLATLFTLELREKIIKTLLDRAQGM